MTSTSFGTGMCPVKARSIKHSIEKYKKRFPKTKVTHAYKAETPVPHIYQSMAI
jgi:hypothetical protein